MHFVIPHIQYHIHTKYQIHLEALAELMYRIHRNPNLAVNTTLNQTLDERQSRNLVEVKTESVPHGHEAILWALVLRNVW